MRSPGGGEVHLSVIIAELGETPQPDHTRAALVGRQQIQLKITEFGRLMGFDQAAGSVKVL